MSLKDFVDRFGVPVGVIAFFALVIVLLPGNTDDAEVATGAGGVVSTTTVPVGSRDLSAPPTTAVGGAIPTPSTVPGTPAPAGSPTTAPTASGGGGASVTTVPTASPAAGGPVFGSGPNCDADGIQKGFSEHMPPCVDWTPGTPNGGATARGVEADQIVVAVWYGQEDPATRQVMASARLSDPQSDVERIWEALRRFFNQHFETYGREVVFVRVEASGPSSSDEAMKADALKIAEEVGAFAAIHGNGLAGIPPVLGRELAQRDVICICGTSASSAFYTELPPRLFSTYPSANDYADHAAEFVAKRMGFEPAEFGGPGISTLPRTYCLMYQIGSGEKVNPEQVRIGKLFSDTFAARGVPFKVEVTYFYDPGSNQNDVTAMIAKLKAEGCTTIIPVMDPLMPLLITREATNQAYFPEWFIVGTGLSDTTVAGRLYDQQQWGNAFGISPLWVTWDDVSKSAGYAEYHHAQPGESSGREGVLINIYRYTFHELFTGIQMAGPNLTPDTFAQGMFAYPPTGGSPTSPLHMYTRERPTARTDFVEVWYDPNRVGPDERTDVGPGMVVKAEGGQRYLPGQWPVVPPSRDNGLTVSSEVEVRLEHDDDGHTHDERCLSCVD